MGRRTVTVLLSGMTEVSTAAITSTTKRKDKVCSSDLTKRQSLDTLSKTSQKVKSLLFFLMAIAGRLSIKKALSSRLENKVFHQILTKMQKLLSLS